MLTFLAIGVVLFVVVQLYEGAKLARELARRSRASYVPPTPPAVERKCPFCIQVVHALATRCNHCAATLPAVEGPSERDGEFGSDASHGSEPGLAIGEAAVNEEPGRIVSSLGSIQGSSVL